MGNAFEQGFSRGEKKAKSNIRTSQRTPPASTPKSTKKTTKKASKRQTKSREESVTTPNEDKSISPIVTINMEIDQLISQVNDLSLEVDLLKKQLIETIAQKEAETLLLDVPSKKEFSDFKKQFDGFVEGITARYELLKSNPAQKRASIPDYGKFESLLFKYRHENDAIGYLYKRVSDAKFDLEAEDEANNIKHKTFKGRDSGTAMRIFESLRFFEEKGEL